MDDCNLPERKKGVPEDLKSLRTTLFVEKLSIRL